MWRHLISSLILRLLPHLRAMEERCVRSEIVRFLREHRGYTFSARQISEAMSAKRINADPERVNLLLNQPLATGEVVGWADPSPNHPTEITYWFNINRHQEPNHVRR